ncbi:hypothetical protein BAU17_05220 [Enterococcus sp. CU12B]|uniref:Uncharacterized protein n=1 Tax=Candidatus Enterococcus willemsii TaxID=1857215 RepID=A0ABQ6YXI0_9ENTE|nr:hypothetical protein BAU17_05220 [Enterococcus sp. CU12B]
MKSRHKLILARIFYSVFIVATILVFGRQILLGNKLYIFVLILTLVGFSKELWLIERRAKKRQSGNH